MEEENSNISIIKGKKEISLAYTEDEVVLGRIIGYIDYDSYLLKTEGLAVEKEARGKGVGRKLLSAIENLVIAEDCSIAFVETVSFSAPQFYEKQGYSVLGTLEDYPLEGIINYFFYKRLKGQSEKDI